MVQVVIQVHLEPGVWAVGSMVRVELVRVHGMWATGVGNGCG